MITLNVNGQTLQANCDPNTPLLWILRDVLSLTGTKYGCGIEECSACTVWIDGSPEKSCVTSASDAVGAAITTIEGVGATAMGQKVQQAWIDLQVPQCGYCQSGMIMAATALLQRTPKPTDAQIDSAMDNICACGTYTRVRAAIHLAAGNSPVTLIPVPSN